MENNININDKDLENAILQGEEVPFFMTPNAIFDLDLNLNIYEKIVYIYISRCSNNGKIAFPSIKTIAKKCGMGETKARYSINSLVEKGLIKKILRPKENKNNLSNIYSINRDLKNITKNNEVEKISTSHEIATHQGNISLSCEASNKNYSSTTSPYEVGNNINTTQSQNKYVLSHDMREVTSQDEGGILHNMMEDTSQGEGKKELLKNNYNKNNNRKEKEDLALSDSIPNNINEVVNIIDIYFKTNISEERYNTYIKDNVKKAYLENNALIIPMPNEFTKSLFTARYLEKCKNAFKGEVKLIVNQN